MDEPDSPAKIELTRLEKLVSELEQLLAKNKGFLNKVSAVIPRL